MVLEADWNGKVLWEVRHPDHHHIGILLRNGNVLLNCLGRVPAEIARRVKGGAEDHNLPSALYAPQPQEAAGGMYADYLAELTPAGQSVWEWRSWEHLDPVADGITEVQARHGKSRQPIAIVVEVRPKPLSLHSEIRPCLTGAPEDIQALAVASARAISSAL